MAEPSEKAKVFDVSKPGKTAAGASSRPVIVGHRTILKDPMVTEPTATVEEDTPNQISAQPPSAPDLPAKSNEPTSSAGTSGERTIEPPTKQADKTPEKESADQSPSDKEAAKATDSNRESFGDNPDSAAIDSTAGQAAAKKQAEKAAQEAAAQQAAMEKLVTDKKYFVPIGEKTRKKRSLRHILVGIILILVLGIVLADVLIDRGIIKTSIKAPVSIFHNQK